MEPLKTTANPEFIVTLIISMSLLERWVQSLLLKIRSIPYYLSLVVIDEMIKASLAFRGNKRDNLSVVGFPHALYFELLIYCS